MPDWKRVLYFWRHGCSRMGLTIHALAEITGHEPKKLLREIYEDTSKVYPQLCHDINSPIWTYGPTTGHSAEKREGFYHLMFWTLNRFPVEQGYKGTTECLGIKTMSGISPMQQAVLKKAAKGEIFSTGDEW